MVDKNKKENSFKISKANFIAHRKGINITSEYIFGEALGSGSFGTVRKVTQKKGGCIKAVKIIKFDGESELVKLKNEVTILTQLSHPNIMQVYESYEDPKNFYIVSEFCSGGELFDQISNQGIFSESQAAFITKQILSAVCYSHRNNIVHT